MVEEGNTARHRRNGFCDPRGQAAQSNCVSSVGRPVGDQQPVDLYRATHTSEELSSAKARGAKIYGEVIGAASSAVADRRSIGQTREAVRNVLALAMKSAGIGPDDVGHVHAHGLGGRYSDAMEGQAIADVFQSRKSPVPVVAAKSYFGNLGAAGGMVELIASVLAQQHNRLFATLNYETPDPDCPVHVVAKDSAPPGEIFIKVSTTPQGQASAAVVKRFT